MHLTRITQVTALALLVALTGAAPALALYVPSKLFGAMYTDYGDMPGSTVNHPYFENITPFPASYVLDETGITGAFPPLGEKGGTFERNEHQIRFCTNGETANGQATGHKFQRREDWDIAFDMVIQSPNVAPRKEAGLYFKSTIGNSLFLATSNDDFYSTGPGTVTTVFPDVLPEYSFGPGANLGDYNWNGTVDAADYTIWRDTLGSTEDMRANGNNEGASQDLIDEADYDVWKANFGNTADTGVEYYLGDTLRMRLIYTPPVLIDPLLPDVANDPNVQTPGTIEYIISLNGGPELSSGPLEFTNSWQGIPKDTLIMMRVQNMGTAAVVNDSSTVTFSSFDFNGDLPGSGLGAGAGSLIITGVPEPGSSLLLGTALAMICFCRRRS